MDFRVLGGGGGGLPSCLTGRGGVCCETEGGASGFESDSEKRVSEWAEQSTSEETQPWSGSWGCFFGGIGGGVPGVSATPTSLSLSSEE